MKIKVEGVGEVIINEKDQVGSAGGEGTVYGKNGVAYKIYNDYKKMISLQKINELKPLSPNKNIIIPDKLIYDVKNNNTIGYTMRMISGHELCKLFNIDFKNQNNITNNDILKLVKEFRSLIDFVHSKNILLVDLNELNFIVDNSFKEIYGIDTNSYQTKSFPATAIMEKIRDFNSSIFTELTDWYSWGIIVFQLITGLHPYRGGNVRFENMPAKDRLLARMKAGVSVFDQDSTMPSNIPDLQTLIPKGLLNWFKSVYGENKRSIPPIDFNDLIIVTQIVKHVTGNNLFVIKEILKINNNILNCFYHNNNFIVSSKDECVHNSINYKIPVNKNGYYKLLEKNNNLLYLYMENGFLKIYDLKNNKFIESKLQIDAIFQYKNNVYVKNSSSIFELEFLQIGDLQVGYKNVGTILDLPMATNIIQGGIFQNLLGRYYFSVFPQSGKCIQIAIKELDDYKIINAKHLDNVLILYAFKNNVYDRFIVKFDKEYSKYKIVKKEDVQLSNSNFTVNNSGTVVFLNDENEIEIFKNDINNDNVKVVQDNILNQEMILSCRDNEICYYKKNIFYSFAMK